LLTAAGAVRRTLSCDKSSPSPVYWLIPVDLIADVQVDGVWLHISSDHVQGAAVCEGTAQQPAG